MDELREEFEAWAFKEAESRGYRFMGNLFLVSSDGSYLTTWVDSAWIGWKASRESLVIELPASFADGGDIPAYAVDRFQEAVNAAGVRTK